MDFSERDRCISRLVSNQFKLRLSGEAFLIQAPTRLQRSLAEDIYTQQFEEARNYGAYSDPELLEKLSANGLWTDQDQQSHDQLQKNLEELKLNLYLNATRAQDRAKIRKLIQVTRAESSRLFTLRHSYDHISAAGIAFGAKQRYLLGCSIYYITGQPYWEDEERGWNESDILINKVAHILNQYRLGEQEIRELSRTEPWHSIWSCHKYCGKGLFDVAAVDLTNEQRALCIWSGVYDNTREHPECPSDDIVEDDDMLDGWMIQKRRQREEEREKKFGDEMLAGASDRIKQSQEVFKPAQSVEDARRIMAANDEQTKAVLDQRMRTLKKQGEVAEQNMPDTIRKNQMMIAQKFSEHVKKG